MILLHTKQSSAVPVILLCFEHNKRCCREECTQMATRLICARFTWPYCDAHLDEFLRTTAIIVNPLIDVCKFAAPLIRAVLKGGLDAACYYKIGAALNPYFVIGPKNSMMYSPKGRAEFAIAWNVKVSMSNVHELVMFNKRVCEYARHVILLFVKWAVFFPKDLRKLIGKLMWSVRVAWADKLNAPVFFT